MDLRHQLKQYRIQIMFQYASFVSCLCTCVKNKGVTVPDLRTFLLRLPAFAPDQTDRQGVMLLLDLESKLEAADDINAIFDLVGRECASFLNYDVYKFILTEYCVSADFDQSPQLLYSEHLKDYINKHKISEFFAINPELKKYADTSKQLKLDIDATFKVTKIIELQSAVAAILGLIPSALKIYGIEDGCVIAIFLILRVIADIIFVDSKTFSSKQSQEFRSLSIRWLECNDCKFDFRKDCPQHGVASSTASHGKSLLVLQCSREFLLILIRWWYKKRYSHIF